MTRALERDAFNFKIECSWCGAIIRRTNVKDSRGMCLKCYARMLSEHGRLFNREPSLRWASDR